MMYFDYLSDCYGDLVFHSSNEDGFVVWFESDEQIFIRDFYIIPEKRRTTVAYRMVQHLLNKGKPVVCELDTRNQRFEYLANLYSKLFEIKKMTDSKIIFIRKPNG